MDYQSYIAPELATVIPVLYIIGIILKSTPKVKDWSIPYILTAISLVLCTLWVVTNKGFNSMSIFMSLTQAVLCVAASIYGNQIVKQFQKRLEDTEDTENTEGEKNEK